MPVATTSIRVLSYDDTCWRSYDSAAYLAGEELDSHGYGKATG